MAEGPIRRFAIKLKLGFLDGLPGFKWHFYQGLWYRCLVDREIAKLRKSNTPGMTSPVHT